MTVALRQAGGHPGSRILALGAARGELVVPNADLIGPIDSSDEWIRQRTGVIERRRAPKDTQAIDLAELAGREAIEAAGVDPSRIGTVIVSTISNAVATPSMSTLLTARLGVVGAAAYDVSAACAGYAYGIAQADALIRAGQSEYVLVVGAEKLSEFVDPTDRTISFLLADGAGAALVGPSEEPGVAKTVWGSDGSKWGAISLSNTLFEFRDGADGASWPTFRQEGPTVFRWAVWEMAKVAQEALDAAGIQASDLAAFVPHQANMRIIDEFAKQLKLPDHVVVARDIAHTGNTSAASVPLAMHAMLRERPELAGGLALQIGFGAGLVFGAQVVVMPPAPQAARR